MIFKKILLALSIFFLGFSFSYAPVAANQDISDAGFTIDVGTITPTDAQPKTPDGKGIVGKNAGETISNTLELVVTNLITVFGVLSLLVMTIGAGFMIIYHGQDELLTRGKSIFSYGLISLAVALSAGLLVNFVSYLLYGS